MKRSLTIICSMLLLALTSVKAQVYIGGQVYGGGNHGNVNGSTSVTVKEGNIHQVFGGARMANVGGNAYVHIDGKHATGYTVIDYVYGGNDVSGTIGTAKAINKSVPTEIAGNKDGVDDTWNTYIHLSTKTSPKSFTRTALNTDTVDVDNQKIYIGQLFGGGNGNFTYTDDEGNPLRDNEGNYIVMEGETVIAKSKNEFNIPELDKTYVDIQGGSIVYAYGGGNNATVKEKTVIHIDNPSKVVNHILVDEEGKEADTEIYTTYEASETHEVPTGYTELLTTDRFRYKMGINTGFSFPSSGEFQIGRMFGGNNVATMSIRPTWNLQRGKIRNLYSGGNKGAMTSPEGLLLELDPKVPDGADYEDSVEVQNRLIVDNVYGGCRMADVIPTVEGVYTPTSNLPGYKFPKELSARVLVRGGDVNNVYGGNDITGKVYGGNAVGIYTTIRGDVYGGGNGAYPYTDNQNMQDDDIYGDLYYPQSNYSTTYDALNAFRPNAEQVSIRLRGRSGTHPTIIRGSVYCGGNCATLATVKDDPLVELKIGSFVVADTVFMGNNGAKMVHPTILNLYKDDSFNSMHLTDPSVFANYMEGVAMNLQPKIVFDKIANGDPSNYEDNSSYIGSFYCGGNVGSMAIPGKNVYRIDRKVNIFEKFVGGCNNANVAAAEGLNAAYEGGVLGSKEERRNYTEGGKIKDRLEINLDNLTITPLRWSDDGRMLIWNTNKWGDIYTEIKKDSILLAGSTYYTFDSENNIYVEQTVPGGSTVTADGYSQFEKGEGFVPVGRDPSDDKIRLLNGNVYGGCYNSGHVNGNVIININENELDRTAVFKTGIYGKEASGVELENQRDDLTALALTVFGAGYGKETEIWGSTTVNLNKGYAFQVFGGGELGVVGKKDLDGKYLFNPAYSSTVNLNATKTVYSDNAEDEDLTETEYIYGGGNEGLVCGNTLVNLGNGRIYDAFGGASNADILGHAEVYIGRQPNGTSGYKDGFPWIKDIVYGGNDFGGKIHGNFEDGYDFTKRVQDYDTKKTMLHGYEDGKVPDVLKGAAYVEYLQGKVDTIFGGCYGYYDYSDTELYGDDIGMPTVKSAFVNIRPKIHTENVLKGAFGGGTGYPRNREGDKSQDRSYVLVDIPDSETRYAGTEIFGAGSYNGVGFRYTKAETYEPTFNPDSISAIIDLLHGQVRKVFGGSFNEGITRRTVVNVPKHSTINLNEIFGGAYGMQILPPCDVYESNVNYSSEEARVDTIYGGNNKERRTLYTKININSPVWLNKAKGYTASVFGAGKGVDTWAEHTQVHLNKGAKVYEVFGGGKMGHVLNAKSVQKYMQIYKNGPSEQIARDDPYWSKIPAAELWENEENREVKYAHMERWMEDWKDAWTMGDYYVPTATDGEGNLSYTDYADNKETNIYNTSEEIVKDAEGIDDDNTAKLLGNAGKRYNTNVYIHEGAVVSGYAYGGGLGDTKVERSGDVYGTTYVGVLGGIVDKDVYAGGKAGGLDNLFGAENFTASANAYIKGGMVRNVYGGGYQGHVGHHVGDITEDHTDDRLAEANVVIGKVGADSFTNGAPAILRNAYGGGEGGSVYGTTNITMNNGYIGYRCNNIGTEEEPEYKYVPELDDAKPNDIEMSGNMFGGGYVINSYVDYANVTMYGGTVRGSLYGGGEVGPIGRGTMKKGYTSGIQNGDARIFKAGKTNVTLYDGHVLRNIFGGGRGKDSWGGDGTKYMDAALVATLDMKCKGYIFGQTEVNIFGGEVGTDEGMLKGYGNVFGGCDEGTVYSAYENKAKTGHELCIGMKDGERYDGGFEGYYFKYEWDGSKYDYVTHVTESGQTERAFSEDCKVLVEPHCLNSASTLTIGDSTFTAGTYVPTSYLNLLKDKKTDAAVWKDLDPDGIIIHNAVFAGGNIAAGSSSMYANEKTVFGNATASIHDAYNRDLITIGTGHTGGLYGDGNLTFVDGYRELNITNYGTDYYHISPSLSLEEYKVLPVREQAYYELKYKCLKECTDSEGTTYKKDSNLPQDELMALFINEETGISLLQGSDSIIVTINGKKVPNPLYWEENGVVSIYAGRIMNTIQRADLCGVFGSRMVMKGARDRVPEIVDYTNYTINRVREVSLNKMDSKAGDTDKDNILHGNYFGIYSIVNYLGALTSDVKFTDVRTTNADTAIYKNLKPTSETETFYAWKAAHHDDKTRNNGTCHNHLALASGVYLELTTEESTGKDLYEKVWGPITGVIELDLINVQPGVGGGFVYARNEHGAPETSGIKATTLAALNEKAATKWDYKYDGQFYHTNQDEDDNHKEKWQTSGNFIHSSQTIIDDCYNIGSRYKTGYKAPSGVPAHYWFISGLVYVYDQYISAYTGSPNAYSKTVEIPVTINAASHGTMTLMDVQPNLHAFYSSHTSEGSTRLTGDKKLVINDITYQLNDPISYWDWSKLSAAEKKLFVEDTYVVSEACKIGSKEYPADTVLLKSEYESLISSFENPVYPTVTHKRTINGVEQEEEVDFTDVFHSSNNLSHDTGYLLTYNMTNPSVWQTWYTKVNSATGEKSQDPITDFGAEKYEDGPTYTPIEAGMYGRHDYKKADIISKDVYKTYQDALSANPSIREALADSAAFEKAYITKEYLEAKDRYGVEQHIQENSALAKSDYSPEEWTRISSKVSAAYVCTSTIQLDEDSYIYINDIMTADEKATYINNVITEIRKLRTAGQLSDARLNEVKNFGELTDAEKAGLTTEQERKLSQLLTMKTDMDNNIVEAFYCTKDGLYGGDYYQTGVNYRALNAWSAMSEADRAHFNFNYDALDLLIDPAYGKKSDGTRQKEGKKYQYDGKGYNYTVTDADKASMIYSLPKPIDYLATYQGSTNDENADDTGKKYMTYTAKDNSTKKVHVDEELTREQYEAIPNEQRHYAAIKVDKAGDYYVVNTGFVHIETPYAAGSTISKETYDKLSTTEQAYITKLTFAAEDVRQDGADNYKPYYYCRESYEVNENGMGASVTGCNITGGIGNGNTYSTSVPVGLVITDENYSALPNKQKNFTIHGVSPMETSTLFVSRNSNINDLSTEKIITVIYKYDYEESDKDGMHITPVSERHIVNIHITFKSGVPIVEDIQGPGIVLPGTSITMRVPSVTPGAYEITGGGWELFERESYAESHVNGVDYTPSSDPLYWYQDGYYLAYYAKTYLGKTYSNHVPVSVANYHDLKKVMDDKENHLHVDYDRTRLKRDSKIYINDYSESSENGLDLFKNFYDLSILNSPSTNPETGLINDGGAFNGHKPLNTEVRSGKMVGVKGGENLDFFLRTNINHTGNWTPIAGESDPCFNGTLHGDGHTISGLNNSLFHKLCGQIYNLGVTGSFTGAGIVDEGEGYVESCWINTTGTPDGSVYAVFGDPTATEVPTPKQIVNSYYQSTKRYKTTESAHGNAIPMPDKAFYNGEVAYDLNNFYLYKRYNDGKKTATGVGYQYWKDGEAEPLTSHYVNDPALCSSGYNNIKYVEDRFEDGDFRYAAGEIPAWEDERHWTEEATGEGGQTILNDHYAPIWPDDYIFFGQKLTYGYSMTQAHQDVPTAVVRIKGRLADDETANRVYRAPAYFRSKNMSVAHFNPDVYLAQKKSTQKDGKAKPEYADTLAYPNMTAIDFAGHNASNKVNGTYKKGMNAGLFYEPLLDDDGLTSILNCDETKNILVYAPAEASDNGYANKNTYDVLDSYFTEPAYTDYYDNSKGYRLVEEAPTSAVHGHLVLHDQTASRDHLLVDKEDFNAPISYAFDADHCMWYQRTPTSMEFVNFGSNAGWQGLSLPFTAELVTTHEKGEITHFYSGSETSKNGTGSKIGHEYWLRELNAIAEDSKTENETTTYFANATFNYPTAGGADKNYTNTFLWDYYYNNQPVINQKDKNDDTYQTYYETAHIHPSYPLLSAATPYILGLPGKSYYEFDLSGNFKPENTANDDGISKLNKQIITFASDTHEEIGVSDDETKGVEKSLNGTGKKYTFTFKPSYMNETLLGTDDNKYALNDDGDRYTKVTTKAKVNAFRPYFIASTTSSSRRMAPEYIVFSSVKDSFGEEHENDNNGDGALKITSRLRHIIVTSTLKAPRTVTIHNAAGIRITTFTIEPGQTIETRVNLPGFYVVNNTKIAVR